MKGGCRSSHELALAQFIISVLSCGVFVVKQNTNVSEEHALLVERKKEMSRKQQDVSSTAGWFLYAASPIPVPQNYVPKKTIRGPEIDPETQKNP